MGIQYHYDLIQGTPEWFEARRGLLTASEMKLIITPANLKAASNDKERSHLYELGVQRVTGYVEPSWVGDDMLRGKQEEIEARIAYAANYAPVKEVGFITNDKWGFTLGYSPDGLVGEDGQIECKSRKQKLQFETILGGVMPADYLIQVQTGLLVTERPWCDFVSYCGGLPMLTLRIEADPKVQEAIIAAATIFEAKIKNSINVYEDKLKEPGARLIPTERSIVEGEVY